MMEMKPNAANSTPFTPLGFLERAAAIYGGCVSIVYNQTEYKWSETHDRCRRVASFISAMGIGKNDVVSVIAPNIPAMFELHFAVPMAGAILNCINTRLDARTVSVLLRHSGSKLLFVDCWLRNVALEAISLLPANEAKPGLVLITDEYESEESNALNGDFSERYDELVRRGDSNFEAVWPESEWDPIVLNYTSGTTSAPKGVVLSHRGVFTMAVDVRFNC
uniref:AMP-dependent synthetase/ligase domain-containing protein n=1 Tax=Kalanchoe fedtschenkoi TaxID=63787 RepID=A0A7N0TP75_KALFE